MSSNNPGSVPQKDKMLKCYYVGDPSEPKTKRGQDKYGYVHCQVWVYIRQEGENRLSLWDGGSGIGSAKTLISARKQLHAHVRNRMEITRAKLVAHLAAIDEALATLGDQPLKLERYAGTYKDNP